VLVLLPVVVVLDSSFVTLLDGVAADDGSDEDGLDDMEGDAEEAPKPVAGVISAAKATPEVINITDRARGKLNFIQFSPFQIQDFGPYRRNACLWLYTK
jgi:hypothetical protein